MDYDLVITGQAEELLDQLIEYLLLELQNRSAAVHLLDQVESIYKRLRLAPLQFPLCEDPLLMRRGFHKAKLPEMSYIIIYKVQNHTVYVMGFYHELENYEDRL